MTAETRARLVRSSFGGALGLVSGLLGRDLSLGALVPVIGFRIGTVLALAILGALLASTRARRIALVVPIAAILVWLTVAYTPLTPALARSIDRRDPPAPGDAVFVFSSGVMPDGGPTIAEMSRLFHGVEIVAEGRAKLLVVSELPAPKGTEKLARTWLDELHIEGEVVAVEPAYNSHDEAVLVAKLARERGLRRIIAVTSPVHEKRACAVLERQGLDVIASPARETLYDATSFGTVDDRLTAFGPILHELVGLAVYRWRGWIR